MISFMFPERPADSSAQPELVASRSRRGSAIEASAHHDCANNRLPLGGVIEIAMRNSP